MATFTFTPTSGCSFAGDRRVQFGTIASSGAFTAGGNTIDPAVFGMSRVDFIVLPGKNPAVGIRTGTFIAANPAGGTGPKFRVIINATGAEYTGSASQTWAAMVVGF